MERAVIRADRVGRAAGFTIWQFRLVNGLNEVLVHSNDVRSGGQRPTPNPAVMGEFNRFMGTVQVNDWVQISAPPNTDTWWAVGFAKGSREEIDSEILRQRMIAPPPQQINTSPGRQLWSMWGITLMVVIALFAICVVLVFTAEFRVTPGT